MKRRCLALCLIAACALAFGCASKGGLRVHTPLTLETTEGKSVEVNVQSKVEDSAQETAQFESAIIARLKKSGAFGPVFTTAGAGEGTPDLKLQVTITELKKVGSGARVMMGALGGRGRLLADVNLVDGASGESLGQAVAEGKSSGGTVFAGTTSQAIDLAADQVAKFVTAK
jgi:hypothetical protein